MLFTPGWSTAGEHACWTRLLDSMRVGRTELPNRPLYVPADSQETMPAPGWSSFLSTVDGSLNPVLVSDLHLAVPKELVAGNVGLTLLNLKKRSEYSSVTTTAGECYDEQETRAVPTPVADADDQLSEVASSTPPVDAALLTLMHGVFLAQLLMEGVDLGEPTPDGSPNHAVFSMCDSDGSAG